MLGKELSEIKSMALNYSDPIRGKLLALVAYIETYQSFENELKEIKEIVDSIPFGGSKEGRPDYVTMLSSDKVLRLRQLTSKF